MDNGTAPIGFHEGELSVQRRAGVELEAARLEGMLAPARLAGGAAKFLGQREFAVLTARDGRGTLWISPLVGPAGFLDASDTTLDIHSVPLETDPLGSLPEGQQVGVLTVEFATRRRMRVNGTLTHVGERVLEIAAAQAFGNCPSYIQQRRLEREAGKDHRVSSTPAESRTLTAAQQALIRSADTFFLGTVHPTRGADASHKGGLPGFVRVDGAELWWPDYAGNNMFNSMGNIAVNPETALLFIDFTTGATLQLSGEAELQWVAPGSPGDDGHTGRRIRFRPSRVVMAEPVPIHSRGVAPSPHNPPLAA